jgi:hypothetical protein
MVIFSGQKYEKAESRKQKEIIHSAYSKDVLQVRIEGSLGQGNHSFLHRKRQLLPASSYPNLAGRFQN